MNTKTRRIILSILCAIILLGAAAVATAYYLFYSPTFHPKATVYIYVDRDDTADSVYHKIDVAAGHPRMVGLKLLAKQRQYERRVRTGRYAIRPKESAYQLMSHLLSGHQEPINLTIGSDRFLERMAGRVGRKLMVDSAEIMRYLTDTAVVRQLGYTAETLPALFLPDTYQVYWDVSVEKLIARMQKEYSRFWNAEREAKAKELGMSKVEVATLASIVEEETNNRQEKPVVAGLYINRLKRGMPLQADPTVKFALQDFALRRITFDHLRTDSPYNTYLYPGLTPGPIRIPSKEGVDAVLNYTRHHYLYMCAKEDFSGTHNFASTLSEHNANARRYQQALNRRKIYN